MRQYLSLSAFAQKLGCLESDVETLIAEKRIKAYTVGNGEPFIHQAEIPIATGMLAQGRPLTDNEENVIQAEKDQASRAYSRAKIAAERKEENIKIEVRRLKLSKRFAQ